MSQSPWPLTMSDDGDTTTIGGVDVRALVAEHGSPLWVVDEHDLRDRSRRYVAAFPGADVAYASKAWCNTGILQIVTEEGLWIDVASGGELHTAELAGADMNHVVFHGNAKSVAELEMAADLGVGRVVADSISELDRLEAVGAGRDHTFQVWLRITPGIDAHTHEFVRTGQDDSKFGFTLSLGLADEAIKHAVALPHVQVMGIHAHIGSQIFGTDPFAANAEVLIDLMARWRQTYDLELPEVNLGGGMGIRYTPGDHPVSIERYGDAVLSAVKRAAEAIGTPVPRIAVEPGRAIVGPSTVTIYTVEVVKPLEGIRTYVAVNGGMSDNIRPALYEAEHDVRLVGRQSDAPLMACTVVGKHCESGDLVRERARLPQDVVPGDLIAVAATGAYTASMASNYNRLPRPGAVLVKDGQVRPLLRRETYADVVSRDVKL